MYSESVVWTYLLHRNLRLCDQLNWSNNASPLHDKLVIDSAMYGKLAILFTFIFLVTIDKL